MNLELKDKVAIVTGASRGIGASIAKAYAAAGATVVISARKIEALEALAREINGAGGKAKAIACHSGDTAQIEGLVKSAVAEFGKVDVLVNNAATNPYFGPMTGIEWPAFDKTFEVNVRGYFAASRAVALHLMERNAPGAIVNVASVAGIRAAKLQGVYGMTKAAVISMTKTMAVELGPNNIRVNAIAPGFIKTRFASALVDNDEIRGQIVARTPAGRVGEPEDIAPLALYLASDAARFVTGAVFVADGGLTVE